MSTVEPVLGFDLGTSKACVSAVDAVGFPRLLHDSAGHKLTPTVASFHPDGHVLYGDEARQRRIVDPANTISGVIRLLGLRATSREVVDAASRAAFTLRAGPDEQPLVSTRAGDFSILDLSAMLLEHARRVGEAALDSDTRRAVLAVPAAYDEAQRQALLAAAAMAGLTVERIVDEPLAVAAAYAFGRPLPSTVAVYDFGGGKFECAIVSAQNGELAILGTAGDPMLGGDDLDARVVDYIVKAFWQVHKVDLRGDPVVPLRLADAAEAAKAELAGRAEAAIRLPQVAALPGGRSLDLDLTLSREVFARTVDDLLRRTVPLSEQACRVAGIAPAAVREVLLAGGVTKLPFVRDLAASIFGRAPRSDVHADAGVALGAALYGAAAGGPLPGAGASGVRRRVTAQFGSESQQAQPSAAVASVPAPARVGRIATRKMFTAAMPAVTDVSFGEARPVKPQLVEVMASRLSVSTVGGYCDEIIARDVPVPTEKSRVFSTGKDDQPAVTIKVCQGDSRRFAENVPLGALVLEGLPRRPRGQVRIAVTFSVDQDGLLVASARDEATGQGQSVRIQLGDRSVT